MVVTTLAEIHSFGNRLHLPSGEACRRRKFCIIDWVHDILNFLVCVMLLFVVVLVLVLNDVVLSCPLFFGVLSSGICDWDWFALCPFVDY